jgi:hypothetical protein
MRKTFLIRVKSFLASVPRKISCRFFLPVCNPAKMRKKHKGGTYKETSLYLEILFYLWRIEICIGMLLAILHILVRKPALSISHTYLKHVLEIHVYVFSVFPKDKSHNKSFLFGGAWSRDLCSFKCSCVFSWFDVIYEFYLRGGWIYCAYWNIQVVDIQGVGGGYPVSSWQYKAIN